MNALQNKQILIGVTGSIAAYKACEVIRLLRKEGAQVQVMMTKSGQEFVGKATFAALTDNNVVTEMFPDSPQAGLEHINLAINLDAVIILPATANILTKAASGIADDLVSTTLSVCEQSTLFVPAMNYRMWQNPATMKAVEKLRQRGKIVLEPESGQLASLHEGEGRLPEPEKIMTAIRELLAIPQPLKTKQILITAGPTREAIDPVRYISNRSSGKMGYVLAETARDLGAEVTLITGPVALMPVPEVKMINVETADEMANAVLEEVDCNNNQKNCAEKFDYIFMAAAVSDYKVGNPSKQKIKRKGDALKLELIPAPDILKSIKNKTKATIIAFALETENGEKEAIRKMNEKGTDHIVLNYANEMGAGFESNTNRVTIFSSDGKKLELKKDRKDRIAKRIIEFCVF